MLLQNLKKDLQSLADKEKAAFFPRFFKAGPGQYAEGDQFMGVTVPDQRKIAKKYQNLPLAELKELLYSPVHEHRLTALLILVEQYEAASEADKEKLCEFYLKHRSRVNNWDLVDSSAHRILGDYLLARDRSILFELAKSPALWDRRIAMISTLAFIRAKDFDDVLKIAEILLLDSHDLMHKAVGWMLRELGKKDQSVLKGFLRRHCKRMPRTTLRYAIERLGKEKKDFYMKR